MDDINKKLQLEQQRELTKLIKENADIQERINNGVNIQTRTQEKLAKNAERIAEIEKSRLELEEKRKKAQDANFKRLTDFAKVNADLNKEEKKSRDLAKNMAKLLDTEKGKILENAGIIKGQNAIEAKALRDRTLADIRSGKLSEREVNEKKRFLKVLNASGDLQKDILDDFEADTLENMTAEEARQKVLEKAGITQQDFLKMSTAEKALINKQIEKMVKGVEILTEDGFKEMYDEISEMESLFGPMIEKTKKWGKILQNEKLRTTAIRAGVLSIAGAFAKDVFDSAKDVRQELGLSVADSAKFGFQITRNAKLLGILGGNAEEVKNFSVEIANEFGNIGNLTDDTLKQFVDLSAATGLTGQNAAKLANSIMSIQGGTLETSLNTIKVFENLARAEGVSSKIILEDLAEDADKFAEFAKDGGKNLAEAAIAARKLGMNLSTVAGIADKLLDFESSIEKQMEAQVLLGRSLNLDKARELALTGNLKGLAEEVKNQVGSQAEFEAMNVIERRALAEAIGTNVADLGRMVRGEDTSAQLAEKRAAAEEKRGETQMQIMKSMEAMTQIMAFQQGISAAMLAIQQLRTLDTFKELGAKMKLIFAERAAGKAGLVSAMAQAAKAAFSNPLIAIAGVAALGLAAAAIYSKMNSAKSESIQDGFVDSQGNVISTPKGSINLDKEDDMIVGSDLFGGGGGDNQTSQPNIKVDFTALESTSAAQLKETKEMNQINKKLLRQNETLMRELITKTGNSSLANTV